MSMLFRLTAVALLTSGAIGCSSSDYENYQLFPDEYVYEVKYDSIYYYGYNQGCESALNAKGQPDMDYLKDETLDNSDTRFNEGWDAGNTACKEGVRKIMPSLIITVNSSATTY
ncbi:hypothetical protein MD588_06910 [Photobacterium sp. SDRW27]|uniref:hypothetical protein n=1 Tax=Photobacterium obscurum TaxID=2829490 RepID=UPI0022435028|nr:hypothetical protein [Photobacterium obscurum]MCW8328534.1 hypothetical protein [Photobacterium obscurum]